MASLNPQPSSSSARQHQVLVLAGKRQGLELDEIRKMVGGSIRSLSAADCSEWIRKLSGKGLANPPGKAPRPYGRKRTDAIRLITPFHFRRIASLGLKYFGNYAAFGAWLSKNFVDEVPDRPAESAAQVEDLLRQLGTAERAGQIIRVLKEMIQRRVL